MNQVSVEVMGIVWLDAGFVLGPAAANIAENMCHVVIDDDDHSGCLPGLNRRQLRGGPLEKSTQSRDLVGAELRRVGLLEEFPLRADNKCEFAAGGPLHLP